MCIIQSDATSFSARSLPSLQQHNTSSLGETQFCVTAKYIPIIFARSRVSSCSAAASATDEV